MYTHHTFIRPTVCIGQARLGKLHGDLGMDIASFLFLKAGNPSVRSQVGKVLVICEGEAKEGGACLNS